MLAVTCLGQRPEFEVASVKPTAGGDGRSLLQAVPGKLMMSHMALRRLVLIAYGIQDYQLVGDPSWAASEYYDIQARADGEASVQQMEGPMLQLLLEDRFKLASHHETRQLPLYQLTIAKGALKLQATKEGSCTPYPIDSPPPSASPATYCGLRLTTNGTNRTLEGRGVTMAELAANLSRTYSAALGRTVLDVTGRNERFDVHLTWATDSGGSAPPPDQEGPPLVTAIQEQLGLKLESAKGPLDVMVLDHIERPSVN